MTGKAVRLPPFLLVTDREGANRPLVETVRAAVEGGARFVWLRDRDLDRQARRALAVALGDCLAPYGGTLVIGGEIGLVIETGAHGVHVSASAGIDGIREARHRLGGSALVGFSCHSLVKIQAAEAAGADYATLSPIFPTASKPGYGPALGLDALRAASAFRLPVFALGGIAPNHASACLAAGAAGIAVMGGVMRKPDPRSETTRFVASLSGRMDPG